MQTRISKPVVPNWLVAATLICFVSTLGMAHAQQLLDPLSLTKYLDPLPNPLGNIISPVGTMNGMDYYEVSVTQFTQQLHSELDPTTVWGYNGTYPGPTFDVQRNDPIMVNWINDLRDPNDVPLSHLLPYDTTVHGASAMFPEARIVTHLHGGVVEPEKGRFPRVLVFSRPQRSRQRHGRPSRQ